MGAWIVKGKKEKKREKNSVFMILTNTYELPMNINLLKLWFDGRRIV